jgi:SAM-dependent methyltransferase
MLGQRLSTLDTGARRLVTRSFGVPDVATRQKWSCIDPVLRSLELGAGSVVLDAGCAAGAWSLELAARHPDWEVIGVDIDEQLIERARAGAARLGLSNVRFEQADFLAYSPPRPVDAVLSVCSAHYLIEQGRGEQLFARVASWLRPGGSLVGLLPRPEAEVPFTSALARPVWHEVVAADDLRALAAGAGLHTTHLSGRIGRLGTLAKQLVGRRPLTRPALYPAVLLLAAADRPRRPVRGRGSMYWLFVGQV